MSCINPATGSATGLYYVEETVCNTTPDNPVWQPLPFTGGIPQLTMEIINAATLTGNREMEAPGFGNKQATGESGVELRPETYDDFIQAASQGTWSAGATEADLEITVDATAKTFTRSAGDFTANTQVGDFVSFPELTGGNSNPLYVTEVTATVITAGNAKKGVLADEATATTTYKTNDTLTIGNTRRTFSLLIHYKDLNGGLGGYDLITGVEITGQSYEIGVNARVTGTFPMIGRTYTADAELPAGSTFAALPTSKPYDGKDGRIYQDGTVLGLVTTVSPAQDNTANALFEIGSDSVAAIEYGKANNTFTISSYFYNYDLFKRFIAQTETSAVFVVYSAKNIMAWEYPTFVYSSGAPDVSGEGSITTELNAQAYSKGGQPSLIMRRL